VGVNTSRSYHNINTFGERSLPQKLGSAYFKEESRSLKTLPKGSVEGARLGAHSLNAPLRSAIRERVRGGGGALPRSLGSKAKVLIHLRLNALVAISWVI
jgi:hypothetical protein